MDPSDSNYCLALKDILATAAAAGGAKRTLSAIARRAARALKACGCAIFVLDQHGEFLIPTASFGLSEIYLKKGSLRARMSLPGVLERRTVAIQDVSKDPRIEYPEAAHAEGIVSILGVPIMDGDRVIGEMRAYTGERRRFTAQDKDFLTASASATAFAMQRARPFEKRAPQDQAESGVSSPSDETNLAVSRPTTFAHPSEAEFAALLDFYRIEWLYEPRTFPIKWDGDRVVQMFAPDFYLPELDTYIEITTLKQNLITDKHRKVRRLKELHPEVKIRLINKGDYAKLLAKYGYGPLAESKVQGISRVLFSHAQLQRRVGTMARRISQDYAGREFLLVGVLKGVLCFLSDLMQRISVPLAVDFMAVSYWSGDAGHAVTITKDLDTDIADRHVLMVEDIVDTGMTLNYLADYLRAKKPASLEVCALLDKRVRRLVDVPLRYVGFEIPDEFVVGYGLDYQGQYRNLPFVGVLGPQPLSGGGASSQNKSSK